MHFFFYYHFYVFIGREQACRLLMECGAPAGVYDDTGQTCLTHMIDKMPEVASEALEQFQKVDKASRTVRYYLSYLETQKWNMLRDRNEKLKRTGWRELTMREPLEVYIFTFYSFLHFKISLLPVFWLLCKI